LIVSPIVTTSFGLLRGSDLSHGVHAFKGIPYAASPVGDLRWRPPQPAQAWSGIRDAQAFGPDFPQAPNPLMRAPRQDEDCLYLNVWTPARAAPGPLPVMVWLHGGGFAGGSGSDLRCDGAMMASRGAVVVTFNYRSGLFGFLAHPALSRESEQGVSGNYGLLDQLAALAWVRDNIAAFGGDPKRVTVFGVSAGSASISLLLTSPLARGLFHRAILHSPGAGRPLATLPQAEQAGRALGDDIQALRNLPSADLFSKTSLLSPKVRGLTTPRVLRPIHDGWVLAEDERAAFKAGHVQSVPVIVGSNADEGTLLTKAWPLETLHDYEAQLRTNFAGAEEQARALYPASEDAHARLRVADMFADTQFNYGTRLLAQTMAAREPRTWRYVFTRRPPAQPDGPHHGQEVAYVFGNLEAVPGADECDRVLSEAMMGAWMAFARCGDPNGPGLADWPAYRAAADNHLEFGDRIAPGARWRSAQLDFLDSFHDTVSRATPP
jgi:para-nitrobenzyl esterase